MTIVQVEISNDTGKFEVLVMNIREDLLHDFEFFLDQAKACSGDEHETRFKHQRFLRAALLTLFAYADAVANGWVKSVLENHQMGFLYKRLQFDCLDKKIDFLNDAYSETGIRPNVKDAKEVRNLFVHFTPGRDAEAFEKLTLTVVENAKNEVDRWMAEMESMLGLTRHPNSEQIVRAFDEIGTPEKGASSGSRK
jgi:hypothetical protein